MARRRFPASGAPNDNLSRSTSVRRSDEGMNPDESDGGGFDPSPVFLPGRSESPAPSHPAPLELMPESRNPPWTLNPQARNFGSPESSAKELIIYHVLRPLVNTQSLRDFHQLVRDCTRRMETKEFICLRDLERTLILESWNITASVNSRPEFLHTMIHCVKATVPLLSEDALVRQGDRPYDERYFTIYKEVTNAWAIGTAGETVDLSIANKY
ncbi:uncharacterized protein K444DRAFT_143738 [Hyaloscypha bicolor E]|uniref:Uncharacterized protein n=1 Tax=Hyaloscypha bicolor E TaxID=1095630 RepID=A0A2J6SSC7_9HELO|nr:uncharacterized protein K444DRAFT_143738 [Hyaloscypha bicolor E]PMD53686.1 hypothetical protein K444DRAFT_143738 [Hyaloscypha bicolor E]